MRHGLYLLSIILFCGPLFGILWLFAHKKLQRYSRVLLVMLGLSLLLGASDYFAIRWRVWDFSAASSLNLRPFGEIESYVFSAAVTICLASITLLLAERVDENRSKRPVRARSAK